MLDNLCYCVPCRTSTVSLNAARKKWIIHNHILPKIMHTFSSFLIFFSIFPCRLKDLIVIVKETLFADSGRISFRIRIIVEITIHAIYSPTAFWGWVFLNFITDQTFSVYGFYAMRERFQKLWDYTPTIPVSQLVKVLIHKYF